MEYTVGTLLVRVWNWEKGSWQLGLLSPFIKGHHSASSVFSPEGKLLLPTTSLDSMYLEWDIVLFYFSRCYMNTDFLILVYANLNLLSKERYCTIYFKAICTLIFSYFSFSYSFLCKQWSCIMFIIIKKQVLKGLFT